jgi:hypothetical protein
MVKEHVTATFPNTAEQASQVRTWSGRYAALVERLGELGSQVHVGRTLEHDQDIPPHNFVRGAVHRFIFPPQQVTVKENNFRVIDPTPGYGLRREEATYNYDEAQVRGLLEITYDDADSRIAFSVHALKDGSEFPEEVFAALAQAEMVFDS